MTLPCCNQAGFLRTSSKGLKHFVHAKSDGTCDWQPETSEHLKSKVEIIKACHENNWKAIPEFSENDWRADVLAIKDDMRIAFEVQWSKQTMEETNFRQQRYKESNVRGCWFFRSAPKELTRYDKSIIAVKETPSFKIEKDDNGDISVAFNERNISLKEFVDGLLKRKIRFCEHYRLQPRQEVGIVIFDTSCWKCKKAQHSYTVDQHLKTICNEGMSLTGSMWSGDDLDRSPVIVKAVKEIMMSDEGIKIGEVKKRYSNTIHNSYLSHGCYYCDALFGDFHLTTEKMYGLNDPNKKIFKKLLELGENKQEGKHWCHAADNQFCE